MSRMGKRTGRGRGCEALPPGSKQLGILARTAGLASRTIFGGLTVDHLGGRQARLSLGEIAEIRSIRIAIEVAPQLRP